MGAQVVHHDADHLRLGVLLIHQPLHLVGEVLVPSVLGDGYVPPAALGLAEQEEVPGAAPLVFVILSVRLPRLGGQGARFSPSSCAGVSSKQITGRLGS